jgi:hypothetical protein
MRLKPSIRVHRLKDVNITIRCLNGKGSHHFDFVNIHAHKSSKEIDGIFNSLVHDDFYSVEVNGEKVYLPSPNLHALFLIRHVGLFFVEKHT